MSPKVVDKPQKRQSILAAAIRVFLRKGYHSTKMEDIAQEADVAKGTIYQYFKSRDQFPAALFDLFFGDIMAKVKKIDQGKKQVDYLDAILRVVEISLADLDRMAPLMPVFFGLLGERRLNISSGLTRMMEKAFALFTGLLVRFIKAGQAEGQIRPDVDPEGFARMIVGAVDGFALHYCLFKFPPAYFERQKKELLRMVKTSLGPKEAHHGKKR